MLTRAQIHRPTGSTRFLLVHAFPPPPPPSCVVAPLEGPPKVPRARASPLDWSFSFGTPPAPLKCNDSSKTSAPGGSVSHWACTAAVVFHTRGVQILPTVIFFLRCSDGGGTTATPPPRRGRRLGGEDLPGLRWVVCAYRFAAAAHHAAASADSWPSDRSLHRSLSATTRSHRRLCLLRFYTKSRARLNSKNFLILFVFIFSRFWRMELYKELPPISFARHGSIQKSTPRKSRILLRVPAIKPGQVGT